MQENTEITDDVIRGTVAKGKRYCVRFYKAGPKRNQPEAEAEQIQKEHLRYLFHLKSEGILVLNGPVIDDPMLKGVGIFNLTDMEEVKRLSDEDPAVKAGRLIYELYLWFGLPGDGLPK